MTKHPTNTSPAPSRVPSVRIAFQTLGRTLRHGYDNLWTLAMASLLWYAGALLIVPLGLVTAALHRVTRPMSEERATHWRAFFTEIRADFRWGSMLLWPLVIVLVVLQANISFYSAASTQALQLLAFAFGSLLFVWLGIMLYAFPMALRQEEQRLRLTLRNTAIMVLAHVPGVLLSMLLLLILCVLLAVIPPLFILIPGVVALWGEENVRLLLVASGHIAPDEIADRPRRKA